MPAGKYKSIAEIVADPYGPALAFAQDMSYTDWCNFNIKNFVIRERVLNQVVNVNIDGKQTPLTNPDTHQALRYTDFITDRSGPKFSGYLNAQPATEYLNSPIQPTRRQALIEKQRQKTLEYCAKENLPVPPEEDLNNALSMFNKLHNSQRKLSDFDLTAQDTHLLERAIAAEVTTKLDEKHQTLLAQSPQLSSAIGKTAWQEGGAISTAIITECLDAEVPSRTTYMERVRDTMIHPTSPDYVAPGKEGHDPNRAFTHILIEDVGKKVREEYVNFYQSIQQPPPVFYQTNSSGVPDTYYGLGIPFNEALIKTISRDRKIDLSTHHDDVEIGDIICDNSSIFGKVFNSNQNFSKSCEQLLEGGISPQQLDVAKAAARLTSKSQSEFFANTFDALKQNKSLNQEQMQTAMSVADRYDQTEKFIESGLMFEEAGKKEAQSQLFKSAGNTKKLIGNISDTGAFMAGVATAANDNSNPDAQATAKAHQQMTVLSTMVNVARWGIDHTNHTQVANTEAGVKAESFQESLNSRSYRAEHTTGIRADLGWAEISLETAQNRLQEYHQGFVPVWAAVRENSPYFQAVNEYKEAKSALKSAQATGDDAKIADAKHHFEDKNDKLTDAVENMLEKQMPELLSKIDGLATQGVTRDFVIANLVNQIDEAVEFGQNRVLIDQKRATAAAEAKAKAQHGTPEAHPPTPSPTIIISPPVETMVNDAAKETTKNVEAGSNATAASTTTAVNDMLADMAATSKATVASTTAAAENIAAAVATTSKSTVASVTAAADELVASLRAFPKAAVASPPTVTTSSASTTAEVKPTTAEQAKDYTSAFQQKLANLKLEREPEKSPSIEEQKSPRIG